MGWKDFFKPTALRIWIIGIVLVFSIFFPIMYISFDCIGFYSGHAPIVSAPSVACPTIESLIGVGMLTTLPVQWLFLLIERALLTFTSNPLQFYALYFVLLFIYWYLIACIIAWIIGKIKSKKKK